MARRDINPEGQELIESFESCVLYVYDDLVVNKDGSYPEWSGWRPKGTLTIGFGHTDDAKHPLKIKKGLRITREQAEEILAVDLDECEDDVSRMVKVALTNNQFASLVSFQFNTGALGKSTLLKVLNKGDYEGVPSELRKWVNSKGKKLRGLVRRREAEVNLWNQSSEPLPSVPVSEPKGNVVPQAPVQEQPLSKSGVVQGASAAGVPTVAFTADQAVSLIDQIQAGMDRINVGTVIGFVGGCIVLAGIGYALYSRWDGAGRPLPKWWPQGPASTVEAA